VYVFTLTPSGDTYQVDKSFHLNTSRHQKSCVVIDNSTPNVVCSENRFLHGYDINLVANQFETAGYTDNYSSQTSN
jgi:hypothetical protein